jgi:hypothetical protein
MEQDSFREGLAGLGVLEYAPDVSLTGRGWSIANSDGAMRCLARVDRRREAKASRYPFPAFIAS